MNRGRGQPPADKPLLEIVSVAGGDGPHFAQIRQRTPSSPESLAHGRSSLPASSRVRPSMYACQEWPECCRWLALRASESSPTRAIFFAMRGSRSVTHWAKSASIDRPKIERFKQLLHAVLDAFGRPVGTPCPAGSSAADRQGQRTEFAAGRSYLVRCWPYVHFPFLSGFRPRLIVSCKTLAQGVQGFHRKAALPVVEHASAVSLMPVSLLMR